MSRLEKDRVIKTIRTQLQIPTTSVDLTPLPGDASNRRYFRVSLKSLSQHRTQSLILMQMYGPEEFKQSEEAISTSRILNSELPFVNIYTHLRASNLPVPRLYYYDHAAKLLYLEDLGNITLEHATHNASQQATRTLYTKAIDLLIATHTSASRQTKTVQQCIAFERMFDVPLLMWEFKHFLEYGIVSRNGCVMCSNDFLPLQEEFQKIAELIASQQHIFTHRDYHSRNLMLHKNKIWLLDFQDALMGPATYDLASLLRDAYIQLNEDLVDECIMRYIKGMPKDLIGNVDDFRRIFDFTSIHRNLKAAGRFVYINSVKKNSNFLSKIPLTLGYVKKNLQKYPELKTLHTHLAPYVPELS
tara:strand:- start:3434 stop:4510 length:1077 start_codon:yes stop_codon:yes gene_type:complete